MLIMYKHVQFTNLYIPVLMEADLTCIPQLLVLKGYIKKENKCRGHNAVLIFDHTLTKIIHPNHPSLSKAK